MTLETFQPGDLLLGDYPVQTRPITVASGAGELARGTVLGRVTADDKFITSLSAAVDGSEAPECVLAADIDATAGDVDTVAYYSGKFDASKLTIGTGHTVASLNDAFGANGAPMFVKELV